MVFETLSLANFLQLCLDGKKNYRNRIFTYLSQIITEDCYGLLRNLLKESLRVFRYSSFFNPDPGNWWLILLLFGFNPAPESWIFWSHPKNTLLILTLIGSGKSCSFCEYLKLIHYSHIVQNVFLFQKVFYPFRDVFFCFLKLSKRLLLS